MTDQTLDFDAIQERDGGTLYGVTNRSNLLEILGCGIAKPRDAYPKYYRDLLEDVPGHVPACREPIASDVADFVSQEPGQFPVLFAFDSQGLTGEGANDSSPWIAFRVVPVAQFKELCFRNDRELQEFLMREYENVPTNATPCRVAPELFIGQSATLDSFMLWNRDLPEGAASAERCALADKLAGSYCLLANVLPASREWFEWLANEMSGLSPTIPIASVEAVIRRKLKAEDDNTVLTGIIMRSLAAIPAHQGFDPAAVVDAVAGQISEIPARRRKALAEPLELVRRVLNGEADIAGLRFPNAESVFRAMLLALLRPEPARFLSWNKLQDSEFVESVPLAALFVGLASGYTATPVELRGDGGFQSVLSTLMANLVGGSRGPSKASISVLEGGQLELESNGTTIVAKEPDLLQLLLALDFNDDRLKRVGLAIDRLLDLSCVSTTVRFGHGKWSVDPGKNEITVNGSVEVTQQLDVERLKAELARSGIPAPLRSEISRLAAALKD